MLHLILFTTFVLKPYYLTWFHSSCESFYFLTFHFSKFIFLQVHLCSHTQLKYKDEQNGWSPCMFGTSIITEDTQHNEKMCVWYNVKKVTQWKGWNFHGVYRFDMCELRRPLLVGQRSEQGLECAQKTSEKWSKPKNNREDATYKREKEACFLCFQTM